MFARVLKGRVFFLLLAGVLVVMWGCKREGAAKPTPAAAPTEAEAVDEAAELEEGEEYEEGEEVGDDEEYEEEEEAEGVEDEDTEEMGAAEDETAELMAKLAKADLLDGTEDKIVTRCATCALKMVGKPEHSMNVMGYTMYFCSDQCAKSFGADTTKALRELVVPEE